jgi:Protein of unknown function (DUF992)
MQEVDAMVNKFRAAAGAAALAIGALAIGALALGTPAQAAPGVQVGVLTCNVSSGWGFVFGSTRSVRCTFAPAPGHAEHYAGHISKFGVDIGYLQGAVMVWAVIAPTSSVAPGALAGHYVGATGSASVGVGAGANVLVGGFNRSITLQPVSIEGNAGLNVAAGVAELTLHHER